MESKQEYLKCAHCDKRIEESASHDGMPLVEGKVCNECYVLVVEEVHALAGEYR